MTNKLYLNHIALPALSVVDLLHTSKELGFDGVELRNDIGSGDPLTGLDAARIRDVVEETGQEIFSINALQRTNDPAIRSELIDTLQAIAKTALSIGARHVVLCPVNDIDDPRSKDEAFGDLVDNLQVLAPVLEDRGLLGLVEPLGFPQSSLRGLSVAFRAIGESGAGCYRGLLDTFHFALGTDGFDDLRRYPIGKLGLVHLSGVEEDLPFEKMLDDHRILVGPGDRLETGRQLATLVGRGYSGPLAFEPFSPEIWETPPVQLLPQIRASAEYVRIQAAG
jgi:2-keto-myo-inositol isomerase